MINNNMIKKVISTVVAPA